MGLTFDNPNNLNKMLDKFAVVPDPKKTPKRSMPKKGDKLEIDKRKEEDTDSTDKKENKTKK